jgi:hypothetical protein
VFFGLFSAYFQQIVNPQITRAYDDQNSAALRKTAPSYVLMAGKYPNSSGGCSNKTVSYTYNANSFNDADFEEAILASNSRSEDDMNQLVTPLL